MRLQDYYGDLNRAVNFIHNLVRVMKGLLFTLEAQEFDVIIALIERNNIRHAVQSLYHRRHVFSPLLDVDMLDEDFIKHFLQDRPLLMTFIVENAAIDWAALSAYIDNHVTIKNYFNYRHTLSIHPSYQKWLQNQEHALYQALFDLAEQGVDAVSNTMSASRLLFEDSETIRDSDPIPDIKKYMTFSAYADGIIAKAQLQQRQRISQQHNQFAERVVSTVVDRGLQTALLNLKAKQFPIAHRLYRMFQLVRLWDPNLNDFKHQFDLSRLDKRLIGFPKDQQLVIKTIMELVNTIGVVTENDFSHEKIHAKLAELSSDTMNDFILQHVTDTLLENIERFVAWQYRLRKLARRPGFEKLPQLLNDSSYLQWFLKNDEVLLTVIDEVEQQGLLHQGEKHFTLSNLLVRDAENIHLVYRNKAVPVGDNQIHDVREYKVEVEFPYARRNFNTMNFRQYYSSVSTVQNAYQALCDKALIACNEYLDKLTQLRKQIENGDDTLSIDSFGFHLTRVSRPRTGSCSSVGSNVSVDSARIKRKMAKRNARLQKLDNKIHTVNSLKDDLTNPAIPCAKKRFNCFKAHFLSHDTEAVLSKWAGDAGWPSFSEIIHRIIEAFANLRLSNASVKKPTLFYRPVENGRGFKSQTNRCLREEQLRAPMMRRAQ